MSTCLFLLSFLMFNIAVSCTVDVWCVPVFHPVLSCSFVLPVDLVVLGGAYRDRWRSPRVEASTLACVRVQLGMLQCLLQDVASHAPCTQCEADGDESAIASLRKEIQDTTDDQRLHPTRRWVLTACNIGSYDPSAAETSIWR